MKGLAVPKDAEDDVKQFAHNGAADGQRSQLTSLELLSPVAMGLDQRRATLAGMKRGLRRKALPILLKRVLP